MKKYILFFITTLLLISCIPPQTCDEKSNKSIQLNPEITVDEISEHIQYLASDELGGRFPGTPESKLAQEYIINQYKNSGILPFEGNGYLQNFKFISDIVTGENNSLVIDDSAFVLNKDFIPLGFSENGRLSTGITFVGYGFSIDDSIKWNDYNNVDLEGKWALILRGGPEDNNPHSVYSTHTPLRKKVLLAKDHKAAGVIFLSPYSDDGDDPLIKLKYDNSFSGAGIPVLHIRQDLAELLFLKSGTNLRSVQETLESEMQPYSFPLPETILSAEVALEKTYSMASNIIAVIPGKDPILRNEYIAIGAHYDHLGMGGEGSGSRLPDTLAIHNGADDNASGTAGIIEIGEKLRSKQSELKRSIILINFDAEERGLLGSRYFVDNSPVNIESIIAMVNLDMVGHLTDSTLTVGGTGTSPIFENLLKEINKNYLFNLKFSSEGYGPSDHATFYSKNIPVLFFFTGTHDDYHKPSDDFPIINLKGEKAVSNLVFDIVKQIGQAPDKPEFTEAGPKESQTPSRRFKVTFGIIPAYGSQAKGMEIDGVRKDGPADNAGMVKGDIIKSIEGKDIESIYDYMYRLGELKKGQLVKVTVLRKEQLLSVDIQL